MKHGRRMVVGKDIQLLGRKNWIVSSSNKEEKIRSIWNVMLLKDVRNFVRCIRVKQTNKLLVNVSNVLRKKIDFGKLKKKVKLMITINIHITLIMYWNLLLNVICLVSKKGRPKMEYVPNVLKDKAMNRYRELKDVKKWPRNMRIEKLKTER